MKGTKRFIEARNRDQCIISPYNIYAILSRQVMRIKKLSVSGIVVMYNQVLTSDLQFSV